MKDTACGRFGVEGSEIPVTGIVLSKYDWIFEIFAPSYRKNMTMPLIVVDDGLSPDVKKRYPEFEYIDCPQPFAFCNAVNAGIEQAPDDNDVIVFNDDVIIKTPSTDRILFRAAVEIPDVGILAPLMNNVSNVDQHPENKVPDEAYIITENTISFCVVYITRETIRTIGLMDPGFAVGIAGAEDRDYCLRAKKAGFKFAVVQEAFIQHGGEEFGRAISNTRFREGQLDEARLNNEYFDQKHSRP